MHQSNLFCFAVEHTWYLQGKIAPAHTTYVIPGLPEHALGDLRKPNPAAPTLKNRLHDDYQGPACYSDYLDNTVPVAQGSSLYSRNHAAKQQAKLDVASASIDGWQHVGHHQYSQAGLDSRTGGDPMYSNQHMQHDRRAQHEGFASPPATPGGFSIASPIEPPFSVHQPSAGTSLQRGPVARPDSNSRTDDGAGQRAPHSPEMGHLTGRGAVQGVAGPVLSPFMQRVARQMQHDAAMLADHAQHEQRPDSCSRLNVLKTQQHQVR